MVIKIYISGISGNKEVKKRQQRVLMILESKNVEYQVIDITEPGKEAEKEFMQLNSTAKDSKYPLPPQIFNEEDYCGDYEGFDEANEMDELEKFLKGATTGSVDHSENKSQNHQNGKTSSREPSTDKDAATNNGSELRNQSNDFKHTESESEIKDLTEDDIDIGNDDEENEEDNLKNQDNDEDE